MSGWTIGLFLYYLFCHILYDDLTRFVYTCHKYSVRECLFNRGTISFCLMILIAIFNLFWGESMHPVPPEWDAQVTKNCVNLKRDFKSPETYNFAAFILYPTFGGSYIGLIFEQKYLGTRKYARFY